MLGYTLIGKVLYWYRLQQNWRGAPGPLLLGYMLQQGGKNWSDTHPRASRSQEDPRPLDVRSGTTRPPCGYQRWCS